MVGGYSRHICIQKWILRKSNGPSASQLRCSYMFRLKPTDTLQPLDSTWCPNRLTWNKTIHRNQHINFQDNVLVQVTSHEASRITQGRHKSSEPKAAGPASSEQTYKILTVGCVKTFGQVQEPICIRYNGTITRNEYVVFSSSTFTWVTDTCLGLIWTNKSLQ
jgi:MoaA/NifB/PqqE/SkfB family radical SAM enzyme